MSASQLRARHGVQNGTAGSGGDGGMWLSRQEVNEGKDLSSAEMCVATSLVCKKSSWYKTLSWSKFNKYCMSI